MEQQVSKEIFEGDRLAQTLTRREIMIAIEKVASQYDCSTRESEVISEFCYKLVEAFK